MLITSGLKRTEATADAFIAEGYAAAERHIDARFEARVCGRLTNPICHRRPT
ncbi:hypothetical protein KCG44_02965 [Pacificimonas sp. WHA3]|uniref:Uncharacterized protein n=1 Tax=Pacificimonas pallii TaxID=2827236 RepID=A0ABS6SBE8_9SPHN|nr:hypothetical protein [Pacificimonas pallii]MBV7255742.1 hypothetical protein [Pacificimonas pallii]